MVWLLSHCLTLFPSILYHVLFAMVTLNHYNFPPNYFKISVILLLFFPPQMT